MSLQSQVEGFHRKFGHPVRTTPQTIGMDEARLAFDLIEEELEEFRTALFTEKWYECGEPGCCTEVREEYAPDLVAIADALGDIIWTAIGAAARHGIDVERLIAEIALSNDSKLGADGKPIYRPDGKIQKGPHYSPPNIERALNI